uniref:Secreted protein n=1 Tax=Mola mola TaxID=94237 RepID=A0A3Q4BHE0_MOLML
MPRFFFSCLVKPNGHSGLTVTLPPALVSRWLISTLAVRVFQSALNAELKIKSVGLLSVQGVSIQFHPQHTLVSAHDLPSVQLLPY